MAQKVAWAGWAAVVVGIVLAFLPTLVGLQTNIAVSVAGIVSAVVLVLVGAAVLRWPEGGLMRARVMGAGLLIAGIVLGVLAFGSSIICVFTFQVDPVELFFYSIYGALGGDPCSVTVILVATLSLGGIVMLASSVE